MGCFSWGLAPNDLSGSQIGLGFLKNSLGFRIRSQSCLTFSGSGHDWTTVMGYSGSFLTHASQELRKSMLGEGLPPPPNQSLPLRTIIYPQQESPSRCYKCSEKAVSTGAKLHTHEPLTSRAPSLLNNNCTVLESWLFLAFVTAS